MRACFAQKLLPLTLCFAVGVGLAAAGESLRSAKRQRVTARLGVSETYSRTWPVINSRPTPSLPVFVSHGPPGFYAVHLRAKFGADAKVSQVVPLAESLPEEVIARAAEALKRVRFTPATENGRPLAVNADVTYEVNALCSCASDMLDNGRCDGGYELFLGNLRIKIVSVEGAKESEGWRVTYE